MANVTISSMRKTETIDLNGGMNVRKALSVFFRCAETAVDGNLTGQSVRLNSETITGDALRTDLRDRDVLTVYPAEVARGGVKGATQLIRIAA